MWKLVNFSFAALAAAAGAFAAAYAAGPPLGSGTVAPLEIGAQQIPLNRHDPGADRVGMLRFMGGLQLHSADKRFGGLSAMLWEPACQRLLTLSDTGSWVILEPTEEEDGRLTGVHAAWIAPLLDSDGKAPANKRAADAESLARTANGDVWVFFEQRHRMERFSGLSACNPDSFSTSPEPPIEPEGVSHWPENGGIEAATAMGQKLVVIAEAMPGKSGGRAGLLLRPGEPPLPFDWLLPDQGYQPTAMDLLSAEEMLVLHRRIGLLSGLSMALTRGKPGASEKPVEVARLQSPYSVDNMEALAIRKEGERTYLYLLSDNNFNPLQRTILLKFELLQTEK